ncbi:MAG: zinc-ribbon domain-containing protein, partial [Candidatus Dormibacteraeota bacterium]|nr:zinc-ribbon domain-containing protein [Candidatus Dormibacteraeota bacterium]
MIVCGKCGRQNADREVLCSSCGSPLWRERSKARAGAVATEPADEAGQPATPSADWRERVAALAERVRRTVEE